jgi:hypothetical protein
LIVEGVILATIAYTLFVEPVRSVLTAAGIMELTQELPVTHTMEVNGKEISFFITDFVDDEGKKHTNFLIGTVETDGGKKVAVVLTEAEVELMKTASFLEAAVDKGIPIGPDVGKKIAALVKKRTLEISRAKSRRATVKGKELSAGARRSKERLQRAHR